MQDCENNTYSCLRTIISGGAGGHLNSSVFCEFYQTDDAWQARDPKP